MKRLSKKAIREELEDLDPQLIGTVDPEYQTRIDAARVSALWRVKIQKPTTDYSNSPLFADHNTQSQEELFSHAGK